MKKLLSALLAAVMVFSFTACTDENEADVQETVVFTDDAGVEISLERPQKVAVLFSSLAEIWQLAGGEIYITVGESVERGFADENVLLVDSGAGKTINTELLISYEPDFVICSADIAAQAQAAKLLNIVGIPAAQFRVESFDDYLNMLKICADITGDTQSYITNGTKIQTEIENIIGSVSRAESTKILFIRAGSSEKSTKAKTADEHFAAAMLKELGTYNIAESAPVLLDGLSIEEILAQNPEHIFITTMGDAEAAKANMAAILSSPAWQSLDAVKNGRVHYLPKDLFQFKPNARWAQAYRCLAEILNEE